MRSVIRSLATSCCTDYCGFDSEIERGATHHSNPCAFKPDSLEPDIPNTLRIVCRISECGGTRSESYRFLFKASAHASRLMPRYGCSVWFGHLVPNERLNCTRYNPKLRIFLPPALVIRRNEVRLLHRVHSSLALAIVSLAFTALLGTACSSEPSVIDQTDPTTTEVQRVNVVVPNPWIPDVVEATTPSIVQVSVRRADGVGSGTGIVFDADGSIVTNWHIIEGANAISVILHSGETLPAAMMREDSVLDIAVLAVDAHDLVPAKLGDSDALRVGEDVVSIGHAFGLSGGPSVSRGVISALDRTVADGSGTIFEGLIQTDAAINVGGSGGALLNSKGEVVGINIGTIDVGQGANFAIDINTVAEGANRLVALGEREQPGYLGLGGVDVTPYLAFQRALPVSEGFGVRYVDPESPAAAGFMIDDIIVKIDDTPIRGKTDFTEFLRIHPDGTDVVVRTIRGAGDSAIIMEIPVTLGSPGA